MYGDAKSVEIKRAILKEQIKSFVGNEIYGKKIILESSKQIPMAGKRAADVLGNEEATIEDVLDSMSNVDNVEFQLEITNAYVEDEIENARGIGEETDELIVEKDKLFGEDGREKIDTKKLDEYFIKKDKLEEVEYLLSKQDKESDQIEDAAKLYKEFAKEVVEMYEKLEREYDISEEQIIYLTKEYQLREKARALGMGNIEINRQLQETISRKIENLEKMRKDIKDFGFRSKSRSEQIATEEKNQHYKQTNGGYSVSSFKKEK